MAESGPIPAPPATAQGFAALGIAPEVAAALAALGYEEPTPIQREAIPHLLAGRDVLGQADTGTGKTAAFALPLLQRLPSEEPKPNQPAALVLVPTRELAMQVSEALRRYGKARDVHILPVYGGQSIVPQLRALDRGVDVVVATPGRALDHLNRGSLSLDGVRAVVLDEADEMLDMGFAEDIEALLSAIPKKPQTALFSATLPERILAIAARHLVDPVRVAIRRERSAQGEAARVRQVAYVVPPAHKTAALARVLDMEQPASAIVFCRTRIEVDELCEALNSRGYRAEALHGGFAQEQRDRVMKRFRTGKTDLLVATDVAARGLDIEHVSHVVNYSVSSDPDDYVHRIGRTGRAGREGVAISFVAPRERRLLRNIEFATGMRIEPATIPTVEDLHTRRLELTRSRLREAVGTGELDDFRALVADLAGELELLDVAAAAVKLAHEAEHAPAAGPAEEPDFELAPTPRGDSSAGPARGKPPFEKFGKKGAGARPAQGSARLFLALGREIGLRPGDLVGAIANEAGLPGAEIGPIKITERFSLVDVPAARAEQVLRALNATTIRGKKVRARFDRM